MKPASILIVSPMAPKQKSQKWWKGLGGPGASINNNDLAKRLQVTANDQTYTFLEKKIFDTGWHMKGQWRCKRELWSRQVFFFVPNSKYWGYSDSVSELDLYKARVKLHGIEGWPWRNPGRYPRGTEERGLLGLG